MSELANTEIQDANDDVETTTTDNEWTPPTREEWNDLLARKNRADSEAAQRKRWLRDVGIDPRTGEKLPDADVSASTDTDDTEPQKASEKSVQVDTAAIEKAASEREAGILIDLAEAGVPARSLARMRKLIDHNEETAPQIEALREEFPEAFKRPRTNNVADAVSVGAGKKQAPAADQTKNYAQILAAQAFGK